MATQTYTENYTSLTDAILSERAGLVHTTL